MNASTQVKLKNISDNGQPPQSRLNDAGEVSDLVRLLSNADDSRSRVRAKVQGLVDGNPPFNPGELRRTGQSYRTNVNFRESEGFLSLSLGAVYDVFSETPTYATVRLNYGDANESETYSRIVTEEFDRLQKLDDDFDYMVQLSQHEMVMFGYGPVLFEDTTNWRCKAIKAGDLLLPEGTKSNMSDWSVAAVRASYNVHELYAFIRNEEAAAAVGWNLNATKNAIIQASPSGNSSNDKSWEHYQEQLRNNDLSYSAKCDTVQVAHVFYREFADEKHPDGAISHCIIDERGDGKSFLFRKVSRYDSWPQALHCLYYDKGTGTHHSVKGLGVKMYSAMELKNRLRCATLDAAFAREKIMFQATTPDSLNRIGVVQQGPYAVMPPGFNIVQTSSPGVLDAAMAVEKDLEGLMQANLSQYRQQLEKPGGNPRTATEIQALVAQQSVLGKTQLNRYYTQLDALFNERYRRASNNKVTEDMPGGREALEFQKRCRKRGVPPAALRAVDWVKATRTAGQGSAFQRQAVMHDMLSVITTLPETGREAVIRDYIASKVGTQMVDRYMPKPEQDKGMQEQVQEAAVENPLFKMGATVPVADGDNHIIHAEAHIQFGGEAAAALAEGGDPVEVAATLRALLPHVEAHIAQVRVDATRKESVKGLEAKANELAKLLTQLTRQLQQQRQQAIQQQAQADAAMQQQQGILNGADPKDQVAMLRAQRDEARKDAKAQGDIQRKGEAHQQNMAIAEAKAAKELAGE